MENFSPFSYEANEEKSATSVDLFFKLKKSCSSISQKVPGVGLFFAFMTIDQPRKTHPALQVIAKILFNFLNIGTDKNSRLYKFQVGNNIYALSVCGIEPKTQTKSNVCIFLRRSVLRKTPKIPLRGN